MLFTVQSQRRAVGTLLSMRETVDLEEALKLTTAFSAVSTDAETVGDVLVPVPTDTFCEFMPRRYSELSDDEREAFRRFYTHVGEPLEDIAQEVKLGSDIDEVAWNDITRDLQAQT